ncbi:MAG: hypothetical protein APR53_09165 [Methanoculleus sp. SDB]|nr:MAG: hypothetical protein APR53_09165 [Methanoculleus sp. SDB]
MEDEDCYYCPTCEERMLTVVHHDINSVFLTCRACGRSLALNRRLWALFLEKPDDRLSDFLMLAHAFGYTGTD